MDHVLIDSLIVFVVTWAGRDHFLRHHCDFASSCVLCRSRTRVEARLLCTKSNLGRFVRLMILLITSFDLLSRESRCLDWVRARAYLIVDLEFIGLGEAFHCRAKKLKSLRLGLRSEITLVAIVICTWAWAAVLIVALQDILCCAFVSRGSLRYRLVLHSCSYRLLACGHDLYSASTVGRAGVSRDSRGEDGGFVILVDWVDGRDRWLVMSRSWRV